MFLYKCDLDFKEQNVCYDIFGADERALRLATSFFKLEIRLLILSVSLFSTYIYILLTFFKKEYMNYQFNLQLF